VNLEAKIKLSLRLRWIATLLPLALLGALSLALFIQLNHWLNAREEISMQQAMLTQTVELEKQVMELESEVRGYLISGETRYVKNVERLLSRLPTRFSNLRALSGGDTLVQEKLDSILHDFIFWKTHALSLIDRKRSSPKLDATPSLSESKIILDRIREGFRGLAEIERESRNDKLVEAGRVSSDFVTATLIVAFLIGGILAWAGNRQISSLSKAYDTLLEQQSLAEAALEESETTHRLVAQVTSDAIWDFDPLKNTIRWGDGLVNSFNYAAEEISSAREWWVARIHPADRTRIVRSATEAMEKRKVVWFEKYRFLRGDGKYATVEDKAYLIYDPAGKLKRKLGAMVDVTDRMRAVEKDAELAAIVKNSSDAILSTDPSGKIVAVNRGAEEIFNVKAPELLNRSLLDFIPTGSRFTVADTLTRVSRGESVNDAWEILRDQEVILLSIKCSPIFDSSHAVRTLSLIGRDITERRKAYLALQQSEERLQASILNTKYLADDLKRSNADLEQFAYMASHDLKEPLRMVSSYIALLERRYIDKLDSDAREFIAFALDGSKRMRLLIDALLSYSRLGRAKLELEPLKVESLVDDAKLALKMTIEETGAQILTENLPCCWLDRVQFTQVFQNLIGNAIKYRSDFAPIVKISAANVNEEWVFSVSDNGLGVAVFDRERIFAIFQRGASRLERPGAGIGLAVCKKIIERHRGRIWVESTGAGSLFQFTLPIFADSTLTRTELDAATSVDRTITRWS
jgi:PAS domain S-box-containing protein